MINSPLGKSDFSIYSNTNASYNESTSFIGTGKLDSTKYYDAENADFDYDLFHDDFPDLNEAGEYFTANKTQTMSLTQRLRLTYRTDLVELIAGGRTRMNKSWYTIANANVNATWSNQVEFSMNWTIPCGLNIIADADYNWYNGYTTPQEPEFIWNAEITQLVLNNHRQIAVGLPKPLRSICDRLAIRGSKVGIICIPSNIQRITAAAAHHRIQNPFI